MPYCAVCSVTCAANYQYQQHLSGRKHLQAIKNQASKQPPSLGTCFLFAAGRCSKGSSCSYRHVLPQASPQPATFAASGNGSEHTVSGNNKSHSTPTCASAMPPLVFAPPVANTPTIAKGTFCLCKRRSKKQNPVPAATGIGMYFTSSANPNGSGGIGSSGERKLAGDDDDTPFPDPDPLPTIFHKALFRKTNNSIDVSETKQELYFRFNYDEKALLAVKSHLKGRRWDTALKCWCAPLNCLPQAIILFRHLVGRDPDSHVVQRALQMENDVHSRSIDDITLVVWLNDLSKPPTGIGVGNYSNSSVGTDGVYHDELPKLGHVVISFYYDSAIVAALKQLAPAQRSYCPDRKEWTFDILTLPEILDYLKPLGYRPEPGGPLATLGVTLRRMVDQLYNNDSGVNTDADADDDADDDHPEAQTWDTSTAATTASASATATTSASASAAASAVTAGTNTSTHEGTNNDLSQQQTVSSIYSSVESAECKPPSVIDLSTDLDADTGGACMNVVDSDDIDVTVGLTRDGHEEDDDVVYVGGGGGVSSVFSFASVPVAKQEIVPEPESASEVSGFEAMDVVSQLKADLQQVADIISCDQQQHKTENSCGVDNKDSSENEEMWVSNKRKRTNTSTAYPYLHQLVVNSQRRPVAAAANDCDCGYPRRIVSGTGKHHCRYFGTYHCGKCGNKWTSAYCWKGEKQACRGCDTESFAIKTTKLDCRLPTMKDPNVDIHHDIARCTKCRALGRDCSIDRLGDYC